MRSPLRCSCTMPKSGSPLSISRAIRFGKTWLAISLPHTGVIPPRRSYIMSSSSSPLTIRKGETSTAYNRKTGKKALNVSRPAIPNYATPVVYNIDGKDQLLVPGCDLICSYDPNTGRENWSIEATTRETIGSIVRNGNLLYASGGYPKHETVCITASNTPEIVWISPIRVYDPLF